MVKERGILFSDEMVRAILDGRKTQTRRAVKGIDPDGAALVGAFIPLQSETRWTAIAARDRASWCPVFHGAEPHVECPYGAPGDRLWVREAFCALRQSSQQCKIADASYVLFRDGSQRYDDGTDFTDNKRGDEPGFAHVKWRPSIHLPRWASRITLEITEVRVQRLHDISVDDAIAEGIDMSDAWTACDPWRAYIHLWNRINGDDASLTNPWVWALTFKRIAQDVTSDK